MFHWQIVIFLLVMGIAIRGNFQNFTSKGKSFPSNYVAQVSFKANRIEQKLHRYSEKALRRVHELEFEIAKKIGRTDSAKAREFFNNADQQYKRLTEKSSNKDDSPKQYIPSLTPDVKGNYYYTVCSIVINEQIIIWPMN